MSPLLLGSVMLVLITGIATPVFAAADGQGYTHKVAGGTGEGAIVAHDALEMAPLSVLREGFRATTSPTSTSAGGPTVIAELGPPVTSNPEKNRSSSPFPDWLEKMLIAIGSAAAIVAVEESIRRCCRRRSAAETEAVSAAAATYTIYQLELHEHNNNTATEGDDNNLIAGTSRSDDVEVTEV